MGTTIEIQTPDGPAEAYLTRPDDGLEHPGVLVYMDAIGLRPRIEEMADRIASWGTSCWPPTSSTATAASRSWRPGPT